MPTPGTWLIEDTTPGLHKPESSAVTIDSLRRLLYTTKQTVWYQGATIVFIKISMRNNLSNSCVKYVGECD